MLVRASVTLGFQAVWASLKTGRTFENTCWEGAEKCPKAQNLSFRVFGSGKQDCTFVVVGWEGSRNGTSFKKMYTMEYIGTFSMPHNRTVAPRL